VTVMFRLHLQKLLEHRVSHVSYTNACAFGAHSDNHVLYTHASTFEHISRVSYTQHMNVLLERIVSHVSCTHARAFEHVMTVMCRIHMHVLLEHIMSNVSFKHGGALENFIRTCVLDIYKHSTKCR